MNKQYVSPQLADQWLKEYDYGEAEMAHIRRPIGQKHVEYLAREMAAGRFNPDCVLIALATNKTDGRTYIANGNHTLHALVKSGKGYRLNVSSEEYPTMNEVRDLYALFDTGRVKTKVDSLRAYDAQDTIASLVTSDVKITMTDVKLLGAATGFIIDGFNRNPLISKTIPRQQLLTHMKEWASAYGKLVAIAKMGSKDWYKILCNRKAVASVAMMTLRYQPEKAAEFWRAVATGTTPGQYSPSLRLREELLSTKLVGGTQMGQQKMQADEMAKLTAYCWNKYYEGKSITYLKVPYDKPIEIAGTPPPHIHQPIVDGDDKSYINSKDAATYLGVNNSRIRQLVREGRLNAQKIGRDWIFVADEVKQFAETPRPVGRPQTA